MFNLAPPTLMHIDLNACFASVEQQANPLLRGKPVVVAAYVTGGGCILAASREAKKLGIKTGMRVFEGKNIYPRLIVLPSDPPKYRFVNRKLLALLSEYSDEVEVKSIDEMVINFRYSPKMQVSQEKTEEKMIKIGREIKERIKKEIGDWLTVSIGISTNRYLSKVASNLHKPDGLDTITAQNIEQVLSSLKLEDLTGIKAGYGGRLRAHGIISPMHLYRATDKALKHAFASKIGYDWWLMLHGWESHLYDHNETKTIGHSYALPKAYETRDGQLHQILCQLVEKMGRRLRADHYTAGGMHISLYFFDHTGWNHGEKLSCPIFANPDLYREAKRILFKSPIKEVKLLAVSSFCLGDEKKEQMNMFEASDRKRELTTAIDTIADRWGEFVVTSARMLSMEQKVLDRIAFGGVKGLKEFGFTERITHVAEYQENLDTKHSVNYPYQS